jgi:hypothetical protein
MKTAAWRGSTLVVILTLAPATLLACSASGSGATQPSNSVAPSVSISTTSPATPAPSRSETSPEDQARSEITNLVEKYYAVDEAIASDPKVPLKRYYKVADGSYAQSLLQSAQEQRAKGYRVMGGVKVGTPEIHDLELWRSKGHLPSAMARVCLDVSRVSVVDKKGKSVVDAMSALTSFLLPSISLLSQTLGKSPGSPSRIWVR